MKAIFAVLVAFLLWWAGFEFGKASGHLQGVQEMAPRVDEALKVAKDWEEISKNWESASKKFERDAESLQRSFNYCLSSYKRTVNDFTKQVNSLRVVQQ